MDQSWVLVLAAGKGTRMGGPKAHMDVGGAPWAMRQLDRLARVGIPSLWVVSAETRAVWNEKNGLSDTPRMVTGDPAQPMFHSVLVGIAAIREESQNEGSQIARRGGVFVLPIDVPAPRHEVWNSLLKQTNPAVPAYRGKRGHPVFLPWARLEAIIIAASPDSAIASTPEKQEPSHTSRERSERVTPDITPNARPDQDALTSFAARPSRPPRTFEQPRLDKLIEPELITIEVDDPDVAVNLNSPEDVASWLAARTPISPAA